MSNDASHPLVLVVLDGFGTAPASEFNAVSRASTPFLDEVVNKTLPGSTVSTTLLAHGTHVGLASDSDMGSSEVGHNILGAGRVFDQGPKLAAAAFSSQEVFAGETWAEIVRASRSSRLHFIGLLSDGNIHSHEEHLHKMIRQAAVSGVKSIRVHALLDGRDVPDRTCEVHLSRLDDVLEEVLINHGCDARLASAGGRSVVTMDRYEADWGMVERGFRAHVLADAPAFPSWRAALADLRAVHPGVQDQNLPAFTISSPTCTYEGMQDGDVVVLFNFRGDRMLEIYSALTTPDFRKFDVQTRPELLVAGLLLWDGDTSTPAIRLVTPPSVSDSVSEVLARAGVTQFATAETHKFGHITYFWNGNRSTPFDPALETWVETPSSLDVLSHPEMQSLETASIVATAVESSEWAFIRCNLAACDMVGHTGDLDAAIRAVEVVDEALCVIHEAVRSSGGTLLITADHGNCEEMALTDGTGEVLCDSSGRPLPKTSHTLSRVPFHLIDHASRSLALSPGEHSLENVGSTILHLLGVTPPLSYAPPLVHTV